MYLAELKFLFGQAIWAASQLPGSGPGHSSGAGSPFSDYDARLVVYGLLIGALVVGLLVGAFLVLNLGLLSKRPEDHIGKRAPSDLGFFKNEIWPEEPRLKYTLPAEEDDEAVPLKERKPGKVA
jgi:hypothetical protein